MPKPIRETIGKCKCPTPGCDVVADVRKQKNGVLYLVCSECGVIRPTGARFQNYILENANMNSPATPEPEPEPTPEPPPEKPKSIWEDW